MERELILNQFFRFITSLQSSTSGFGGKRIPQNKVLLLGGGVGSKRENGNVGFSAHVLVLKVP